MAHATPMNMLVFVKKKRINYLRTHVPCVDMNSNDSHEDTTYFFVYSSFAMFNVCTEYALRILNPMNKSHVRCK